MKDIEELPELMTALIDSVDTKTGVPKFTGQAVKLIHEIAEYAKGTKLYNSNKAESESFWAQDAPPEEIWTFMLRKVVDAPTPIHRDAAVLLHMPALEAALLHTKRCRICGCTDDNACVNGCYWVTDDLCSQCAAEAATNKE